MRQTSSVVGVSYSQTESRWLARHMGWYLGRYKTRAEAEAAVSAFSRVYDKVVDFGACLAQEQAHV